MTIIRRFNYPNDKQITAIAVESSGPYLWQAFNEASNCMIQKVGGFEPDQIFFQLEREVAKIVKMKVSGTFLYTAYQDSVLIGEKISTDNPLTTTTDIEKPETEIEQPVDIIVTGSFIYFLIPGNESGEVAKIHKYNLSGVFQSTIELMKTGIEVTNAISFAIDASNEIWVVTNNSPVEVVRVFNLTTTPDFTVTSIS